MERIIPDETGLRPTKRIAYRALYNAQMILCSNPKAWNSTLEAVCRKLGEIQAREYSRTFESWKQDQEQNY